MRDMGVVDPSLGEHRELRAVRAGLRSEGLPRLVWRSFDPSALDRELGIAVDDFDSVQSFVRYVASLWRWIDEEWDVSRGAGSRVRDASRALRAVVMAMAEGTPAGLSDCETTGSAPAPLTASPNAAHAPPRHLRPCVRHGGSC